MSKSQTFYCSPQENTTTEVTYKTLPFVRIRTTSRKTEPSAIGRLKAHVTPFRPVSRNSGTVSNYFDSFSDCKVLLIGDASHGTSELYSVRAEITNYMIENHGSGQGMAEAIQMAQRGGRESAFLGFPASMWRNTEVYDFVECMRSYNSGREKEQAAVSYALDLYSIRTSMKAVVDYLDTVDREMAQ
ncbi:hypothetical protein ACHAQI_009864 [Fusarium lateritium]